MKYLMVCLGNICRSPMAEQILRHKLSVIGSKSVVYSCGFEPYHVGDSPDHRAIVVLESHGIERPKHKARLFRYNDFSDFDKIWVMDNNNFRDVMQEARTTADKAKVDYLLNTKEAGRNLAVPDPYYGGIEGFEHAFELISAACDAIVDQYEK